MTAPRVTGVVLAAGSSRRLGQPKQLLPFRDSTLLDQTLRMARGCGFDQLIVTLGGAADQVRRTVSLEGLQTVEVSYVGYTRGYKSMAYGVFALRNRRFAWVYDLLTLGGRVDFPVYLNLYDIMMFTARKPARAAELVARERADAPRAERRKLPQA